MTTGQVAYFSNNTQYQQKQWHGISFHTSFLDVEWHTF